MKKMCWESILVKNIVDWTSGQDGGAGKHGLPPCTTTAKNMTKLQNNHHPEWSENQAEWKSDNQGIKEVTFIQTDRRGGGVEMQNG